jgi:hypothetical protein
LILQNNSTLSQLPVCHSNQLLTAAKPDNVPLDSLKNLDETSLLDWTLEIPLLNQEDCMSG